MIQKGVLIFIAESVLDVYLIIQHLEYNIIENDDGVLIKKTIYNLPERQIKLRNKHKLPLEMKK